MAAPVFVTDDVPTADQVNDWMVNNNFAYKTADESVTNSSTFQDDNNLVLSVDSSTSYILDLLLVLNGSTAGNIQWRIHAPASSVFNGQGEGLNVGATSTLAPRLDLVQVEVTQQHGTIGGGAGTLTVTTCSGILVTGGTAGSVVIQWAQVTGNAAATTVKAGSYLRLTRIA